MEPESTPRRESLLLVLALILGIWLRIDGIGDVALFGDELHTRAAGEQTIGEIATSFDSFGSHVVLPLLQNVSLRLFGDGVVSFRLVGLVPGILALLLMFPFARLLAGRVPALLATIALAVHPMHVYYSRFGRSYALICLLGIALAYCIVRALRASGGGWRWWVPVSLLATLMPYTHLSSAGFVAALGLAASVGAWRIGGAPRTAFAPIVAFGVAAVLCGVLFVPILEPVFDYFTKGVEVKDSPVGWFGIPVLLAGGVVPAALWLLLFPVGVLCLVRDGRSDALLVCLAALVGPLVLLCVQMPHGMDYAYARYLFAATPFLLIVSSRGLAGALPERGLLPVGVLLVLAAWITGPLPSPAAAPGSTSHAFDNSYLALRRLDAFDVPWAGASPIYQELAELETNARIVEMPALLTRSILLYRNHSLRHGQEVKVGWSDPLPAAMRGGPYLELGNISAEVADYVIVHRDLPREVRRYWRFVYKEAWPGAEQLFDGGMMKRHRATFIGGQPQATPQASADIAALLREGLGDAYYRDKDVIVWKLQ